LQSSGQSRELSKQREIKGKRKERRGDFKITQFQSIFFVGNN